MNRITGILIGGAIIVGVASALRLASDQTPRSFHRRDVRDNPLQDPIAVLRVETDGSLVLAGERTYVLSGVRFPEEANARKTAVSFVNACVRQGVEVIAADDSGHAILRCEPAFYHTCGNDPVRAHYWRFTLNELLLVAGLAYADPSIGQPDEMHMRRLYGAQRVAWSDHRGVWCQDAWADSGFEFNEEAGIDAICGYIVLHLDDSIEEAITWKDQPGLPD